MTNYIIEVRYDDKTFVETSGMLFVADEYWESDMPFTIALVPRKYGKNGRLIPQVTITYKCYYSDGGTHVANKYLTYVPFDTRFTMRIDTSKHYRYFLTLMCGADSRTVEVVVM